VAPDGAEVHPEHIHSCGTQIRAAAQQSHSQNASFQQELAGYGQPWGTDTVGSLMGYCYGVISSVAAASYSSNAAALDDHGAGVQAIPSHWQQAEDTIRANISSVGKTPG
jgi:hypothetical protein